MVKLSQGLYLLKRVNWVMVETSHPGNFGASVRALKNMGCSPPILVDPTRNGIINSKEAYDRAAGASECLQKVRVSSLDEAIGNSNRVIAFTSRNRSNSLPVLSLEESLNMIFATLTDNETTEISLVFGGETNGLKNADILRCTSICHLEADNVYPSLNLSHAIQVVSFCLRSKLRSKNFATGLGTSLPGLKLGQQYQSNSAELVSQKKITALETKILSIADKLYFRSPERPGKIAERLRKILVTPEVSERDVRLLDAFFSEIINKL